MKISKLISRFKFSVIKGDIENEITELVYDSRKVTKGCIFVCIPGTVKDGHDFIPMALEKGAVAFVVTKDVEIDKDVTVIKTEDARLALAHMSAAYFDYPAEKLMTIGITGTKGKTTTSFMVYNVLNHAGIKTGLIGTIETIIGDKHIPSCNSTPESYIVQQYFAEMVESGIKAVVMEVSSQGLKMKRVEGINYDIGVFMNLEPDHIGGNEHPDFEDYLACKRLLFSRCKVGIGNRDDLHFEEMMEGHTCRLLTLGMRSDCDYRASEIELVGTGTGKTIQGISAGVKYRAGGKLEMDVVLDIPGRFTVYNSLTALAICDVLGVDKDVIFGRLRDVKIKGRAETVPVSDRFSIMVDYAHNEMSLRSLLTTLREYNPGRLVCIFGCGGNRSRDRRYTMGRVSGELSDLTIITSDNPRFEEPSAIIDDIVTGIKEVKNPNYVIIEDRYEAVKYAVKNALPGDLIIVAGKGHEDYQEIKGVKYHMDDKELIIKAAEEIKEEQG